MRIRFDVVDQMLVEVMKGFGAVPRRGAEVGGLLVGSVQRENGETIVHVDDFEPISCEHANGPSFLLSNRDLGGLRETLEQWESEEGREIVGYYRSHTRDGLHLAGEDLALLDEYLPDPEMIALLIKPYATRVSTAGIFFREEGTYKADVPYAEFPFRRKELGGGASSLDRVAAAARFGQTRRPGESNGSALIPARPPESTAPQTDPAGETLFATPEQPKAKAPRSGWVWIPLSFIFMLLGVILGFQIAISMRPRTPVNPYLDAWNLSLGVQRDTERMLISWDRSAPAVRNTTRGVMTIVVNGETRRIELTANDVQAGQLIYRSAPETATVRLEVFPKDRTSVVETAELAQRR